MTTGNILRLGLVALVAGASMLMSCGDKKETGGDTIGDTNLASGPINDSVRIQMVLDETVARWKRRDMAVLYDQEFEYFQDKISYDEYLAQDLIQRMEADSVVSLTATAIEFFNRDSAKVKIDAYLKGVTGQEYHYPDELTMYMHRGRWVRPTMANPAQQREYDSLKRVADSAAEAEDEEPSGS